MIDLQLKVDPFPIVEPLVIRLQTGKASRFPAASENDAMLVYHDENIADFDVGGFSLRVHTKDAQSLDGDVVLVTPGRNTLHRLIRSSSRHNTLLITEQCDQKCIMCSQPPKKHHTDMFDYFLQAVLLAPAQTTIGLSGGEPLLHKARLFEFLEKVQSARPDIQFHILTNGQHFDERDRTSLSALNMRSILWGVPIYAANAAAHDQIVVKAGAHKTLQKNLAILGTCGANLELRTVLLNSNVLHLEDLANHITKHQSFASVWAIMQLENIGYARMNWDREFYDSSLSFVDVAKAIDLATGRGMETLLYNFPLCSVPSEYRRFCVASISDWKQKYLSTCDGCSLRSTCTGFFEWYSENKGFKGIIAQ
jgi:His-Xaa-Ser system radical SAM maturase HxsC